MKVSGFTFIRNAVKYDFPVVEAIQSALPIVDEFVVNVGQSEDGTLNLIRSIGSPKFLIVESGWDDSLRVDGRVFVIQQDVAGNRKYKRPFWANPKVPRSREVSITPSLGLKMGVFSLQ